MGDLFANPNPVPQHCPMVGVVSQGTDARPWIQALAAAGFVPQTLTLADASTDVSEAAAIILLQGAADLLESLHELQATGYGGPIVLAGERQLDPMLLAACFRSGLADFVPIDSPEFSIAALQERSLVRSIPLGAASLQQRLQRQRALAELLARLQEVTALREILQLAVELLCEGLDASGGWLALPRRSDGRWRVGCVAAATPDLEACWLGSPDPFDGVPYRADLERGETLQLERSDWPESVRESAALQGVSTIWLVPLCYADRCWGVLCLHQAADGPLPWDAADLTQANNVALHCAIAIHRDESLARREQRILEEQTLNQILRALNDSREPAAILPEIARLSGECLRVDRVSILSGAPEDWQVAYEWCCSDRIPGLQLATAEELARLGLEELIGQREVRYAPQQTVIAANALDRNWQPPPGHTKSALSVPVFRGDRFWGAVVVATTGTYRSFSHAEGHLLRWVAEQVSSVWTEAPHDYAQLGQQVRQQMRQLEREKQELLSLTSARNEFFATMSHELRAPLANILGFAKMLRDRLYGPLNERQQQYVESLYNCSEYLLSLVNNLLDLSKIEAEREDLNWEAVRLKDICRASLEVVSGRAEARGLGLDLQIDPELDVCQADRLRLQQVLVNLLSNAIKFTDTGSVSLQVNRSDREVQFSVIDTGIGIAEADLKTLFRPFRQIRPTRDRGEPGTGLGLALSMKLAQLHGGNITAISEPNRGSCFTLHLPIHSANGHDDRPPALQSFDASTDRDGPN